MKRLGGIITVLLVVLCLGTVISCAGTKDAVVKDSKKRNTSNTEENGQSLSEPILDSDSSDDAVRADGLSQKADFPAESFLVEDSFADKMLAIPNKLQIEKKEAALKKEVVRNKKADKQFSDVPKNTAFALNENNSNKGSVLFTLKRAEEVKEADTLSSIDESAPNASIAKTERPTMSVLQERLIDYKKNDKKQAAKADAAKVDSPKTAVAKADTAKTDSPKADVAKADTAKTGSPKAAVAKADAAKTGSPKADVAKTDAVKTDSPKTAVAKVDAAKTDSPKAAVVKTDTAKIDSPKAAVAKTDAAKTDSPKTAVVKTDTAKIDSPKTAVAKTDAAKIDSPKAAIAKTDAAKTDSPKTAVAKADVAKVKPVVAIPKKSSKDYESKLIVLPAISVLPMKPEVMIQKKTYLTQIIALPEIAEEVGENTVQADESISSPKALEISLGNSVNAFGLPENFVSPYAVADIGKIADNKDNSVAEQTKVMPNTKKQRDILPPAASVPEIAFAEKNQDEQNAALTEILSANKIKTSVVIEEDAVKNKNAPIVYSQVHEPEELEDVADFEMKPDFIYPDEKISALENQETIIRMQGTGWRIDAMNNYSMKLIDRRNDKNESTTFRIKNGDAGTEQITFTRYNEAENRQETQVYFVDIKPVLPRDENNTEAAPKTEKSRADDDYRKTLADRLYADENYAQASVYYKKLIDENISDNELLYKAAHSMKAIGNIDSAAEYYQRNLAEEGNPFYDDAIIEYIQLLKEQKEFDKAINEVYERGLSKSVSENCTQKLYGILGDLFFNVKNYTEAVRTYKTVLSLYPSGSGDDKALFYLAYALELQENPEFKEAQRFYRELLDVYPESQYVNLSRSRMGFIDRHYIKVN